MTEPRFGPDRRPPAGPGKAVLLDPSMVLVVGRSQVNRVVVTRIVERAGLRPISEAPETASRCLGSALPGIVILDGGADNHDCDAVMAQLAALRQAACAAIPGVILLSTRKLEDADIAALGVVDAVVAKPILPELLQPVVARLIERLQR